MVGDDLKPVLALFVLVAAVMLWRTSARRIRRFLRRHLTVGKVKWHLRNWMWSAKRVTRLLHEKLTGALPGVTVAGLRVVDGDTLDDPATGARYRLANIDCPETDDRAGCYRERIKGEQAKGAAEMIVASAKRIELRPTGRIDVYGRTVAHVRIDDRDFGELMIKQGFARRWDGKRETWCGPDGGLAILARATASKHTCKTCRAGISGRRRAITNVIAFPVAHQNSDTSSDDQKS